MAHTNYISTMIKETKRFVNSAPSSKTPSPKATPTHRELETLNENSDHRMGKAEPQHLLSEMEKLEFGAVGRKLPRLKLGRRSRGDGSTRTRPVASLFSSLTTTSALKKVEDDPELAKVEDAKEKAIAEAKRLGEEARKAQLEVHILTRELEELKREQAMEVSTQAHGGKRWDSEKLTIRFDNRVLKSSDYTMDVQDKGSKIAINLHINGMAKLKSSPPPS